MIILEQMPVFLHDRTAPGCVHRDKFGARSLERRDVPPRKLARGLEISRVSVQRSAALLARRVDHRVPVHLEHALRRSIRGAEQSIHHASAKRSNETAL